MPQALSTLDTADKQLVLDALPLVTLLIAGADGSVDDSELKHAEKTAYVRSYNSDSEVKEYYEHAYAAFEDRLAFYLDKFPGVLEDRQTEIVALLEQLNGILPKLDGHFTEELVTSLRSFAKHIAKADGGFLGSTFAITEKEEELISLPMLQV